MTKKKHPGEQTIAAKTIAANMARVEALIKESEMLADMFGLSFTMDVAYGMGGQYYPNPARVHEWPGEPGDYSKFVEYDPEDGTAKHVRDDYADSDEGLWYASSMSC